MGFRENLLKKIEIEQLTGKILGSIVPSDSSRRVNLEAMRQLLEMGPYHHRRERDLELYCESADGAQQMIIVLDNELKIYNTTVEDVSLRKSPTVKEMLNVRNAIKILNDKSVVVSRKGDTVQRVRSQLIGNLDISFTPADIEALVKDGCDALTNNYAEGVVEILALFAELLGYQKAPRTFQLAHHHIWGVRNKARTGEMLFGPAVLFSLMRNDLALVEKSISSADKAALKQFEQIGKGEVAGDLNGEKVFHRLSSAVLTKALRT